MKILLLEDDTLLNELISERLGATHQITSCSDGEEALSLACANIYDLMLLDVDVPSLDGFSLLQSLRDANISTPAIFITAKTASKDLRKGFEIGANDYIKKPFDFDELEARIENIRKTYRIEESIELGKNAFIANKKIYKDKKELHMGAKELSILEYLAKNRARFVTYDEIASAIWCVDEAPSQATIRTYIKNIRHVLGHDSIAGERGLGWRYDGI